MPPTKPDTVIEAMVRKAYMELIARANGRIPPEQVKLLQDDIEKVWFPREQTAFVASMDVVSFIQRVIESQKIGISTVKDREFAAALLFEYLALAEGIFKFQLCHIAILASFAGYDVKNQGAGVPEVASRPD